MKTSAEVLSEFVNIKEGIPEDIFNIAKEIIVIPAMKNLGFVVAGKRVAVLPW